MSASGRRGVCREDVACRNKIHNRRLFAGFDGFETVAAKRGLALLSRRTQRRPSGAAETVVLP